MPFQVIRLDDSDQKTAICQKLTAQLPDWFGQPEANRVYIDNIQDKTCFAAYTENANPVGLIALKPHFEASLEIWWMAVDPDWHRRGIGRQLLESAHNYAVLNNNTYTLVYTLSPESEDINYAKTRAFYEACGYTKALHVADPLHDHPMIWMIRPCMC